VEHTTTQRLRDPEELGYTLPGGGHRKVTLHERRRVRSEAWGDASASGSSPAAKEKRHKHRQDVAKRAMTYLRVRRSSRGLRKLKMGWNK